MCPKSVGRDERLKASRSGGGANARSRSSWPSLSLSSSGVTCCRRQSGKVAHESRPKEKQKQKQKEKQERQPERIITIITIMFFLNQLLAAYLAPARVARQLAANGAPVAAASACSSSSASWRPRRSSGARRFSAAQLKSPANWKRLSIRLGRRRLLTSKQREKQMSLCASSPGANWLSSGGGGIITSELARQWQSSQ